MSNHINVKRERFWIKWGKKIVTRILIYKKIYISVHTLCPTSFMAMRKTKYPFTYQHTVFPQIPFHLLFSTIGL